MALSLREVAMKAIRIHDAFDIAAEIDAEIDGGEFSGPANARSLKRKLEELAKENNFTYEQVEGEVLTIAYEE